MVNTRLSSLSINEDEYNKAKPLYRKPQKCSVFNKNLKFESMQTTPSLNRQGIVLWFNSPHNAEVKINIGKVFLKLVPKYFHKQHHYKKTLDTNTTN